MTLDETVKETKVISLEDAMKQINTAILKVYDKRAIMGAYAKTQHEREIHIKACYNLADALAYDNSNDPLIHIRVIEGLFAKYRREAEELRWQH
jgi:hypothetical protein